MRTAASSCTKTSCGAPSARSSPLVGRADQRASDQARDRSADGFRRIISQYQSRTFSVWILFNDSFLSVVTDTSSTASPPELLVRGRVAGDIESVFPHAQVREGEGWDYRYRATVSREEVAQALGERVRAINYPNFKDSVDDDRRHEALSRIWAILRELQE